MKTDTSTSVANTSHGQATHLGNQKSVRAKETSVEGSTPSSSGNSESAGGDETLDVARAQDLYTRTEHAARAEPERALKTSEEAAELVENLRERFRQEPEKAIEAQAKGVSPNVDKLLR